MSKQSTVVDNGDLHKYRTEIPNIIDDMDLSVYAFRLYVHLKRVAGDRGQCYQGTRTIAEACQMSVGKVSDAKKELQIAGLIGIDQREQWQSDLITIMDIWPMNFVRYADAGNRKEEPVQDMNTCSPDEHPCSGHEHPCSPDEHIRSPHERKKEPFKKEPNKKEPVEEAREAGASPPPDPGPDDEFDAIYGKGTSGFDPPAQPPPKQSIQEEWDKPLSEMEPHRALFAAVLEAIGWDRATLTERDRAQVAQACRILGDAKYTYLDVGEFMTRIWFRDWRWTEKDSRPTLNQLRQEIGKIRAGIPVEIPKRQTKGGDAVDAFFDRMEKQGLYPQ